MTIKKEDATMSLLNLILFLFAAICFAIVTIAQRSLLAAGLLAWVCVPLVATINALSSRGG